MYLVRIEFCARFNQSRSGLDQKSAPQSRLETKKKKTLGELFLRSSCGEFYGPRSDENYAPMRTASGHNLCWLN